MRSNKQKIATAAVLLALVLPICYLAVQAYAVLKTDYRTETAVRYDMSDSIFSEGFLVFEQQQVPGDGMLGYLVDNGERVPAGAQVAEQYTDVSQATVRGMLTELDKQAELLKKSENSAADDVSVLLTQRQSSFYDLLDQLDRQDYTAAEDKANDYLLALNRLQITTGTIKNFSQAKALLEEERQNLLNQLGGPAAITAPTGGYFIASTAGEWLNYTREQLDAMTAAEMQAAYLEGNAGGPIQGAGKVVTSYTWNFYGTCTTKESEKFEGVSRVNISFPGMAEKTLPAKVELVQPDESSGLVKIVLSCEYVGADVMSLADAMARIDFESYEGIRVNAKALHIVDGEKGVYVRYGNLARWRRISILYQNDEYILVPEDGKVGTENEVRLFDEIIVQGTDLKDGKLLK